MNIHNLLSRHLTYCRFFYLYGKSLTYGVFMLDVLKKGGFYET